MKVIVKTLTAKKYEVEVDSTQTILDLKKKLDADVTSNDPENCRIVFAGKFLENNCVLEESGLKNDSLVVIMPPKRKAGGKAEEPQQQTQAQSTSSSSTSAATPAPQQQAPQTPAQPIQQQAQPQAPARPQAQPAQQPPTPMQSQPAIQSQSTAAPSVSQASSELAIGPELQAIAANLMGLGFEHSHVMAALRASFNNPDRAADYLLNGMSEQQLNAMAMRNGVGAQPQRPAAQPQQQQQASVAPQSQSNAANTSGDSFSDDMEMGDMQINPEEMAQFRQAVQSNPQLIPMLLQTLSQSNPELFQTIQQNPDAFLQMLQGGDVDGQGGQGSSGLPPNLPQGTQVIHITQEEKEQLDRLQELGFSRQRCLEAWLACDRNEEMAANYLLSGGFDQDEEMGDAEDHEDHEPYDPDQM